MLGDARNLNPCHPLMPLAVIHRDRRRPPFGFLPIRRLWLRTLSAPLKRSPPPSPGSRRSPPRRNRAPPRWPLWQARGWLAAHALDCQETLQDDPSLARAIASRSSRRRSPWHLAIAARSNCGPNQVRGASSIANQQLRGRRPTPAFSGAANGIPKTMRNWLRGLRCNALLGRVLS